MDILNPGDLDVGELWVHNATGTAPLGLTTNLATVIVRDRSGGQASDTDPANYTGIAAVPSPMPLMLLVSGLISVALIRARRARLTA